MSTLATTNLKNPNSLVNSFVLNNDGSVTVSGLVTFASGYSANLTASFPSGFTAGGVCTFTGSILSSGAVTFSSGFTANRSSTFASGFTSSGNTVFASGFTSSGISVFSSGLTSSGAVALDGQSELRLADSDSSNYVGFKSPATVPTNIIWTLPSGDGSNDQLLSTNGSGVLSWATPSTTAVNLSGGVTGAVPYQASVGTTAFLNPGVSGQVLATQGAGSAPAWITPGGGKVLQVVQGTLNTYSSITSTSAYVSTGLEVNITPSSTSSKIFLFADSCAISFGDTEAGWTFFRNGVNVLGSGSALSLMRMYSSTVTVQAPTFQYLDSPNTTSTITYGVYQKNNSGNQVRFNYSINIGTAGIATIQAIEIGP